MKRVDNSIKFTIHIAQGKVAIWVHYIWKT